MNFNDAVMQKVVEQIDLSQYKDQINDAVKEYFKSDYFQDAFSEALADEGIAGEIAGVVSKKIVAALKKNVTVSIKGD